MTNTHYGCNQPDNTEAEYMQVFGNSANKIICLLLVSVYIVGRICFIIWDSSETKSWKALENNAILYPAERFMKAELDLYTVAFKDYNKCHFV